MLRDRGQAAEQARLWELDGERRSALQQVGQRRPRRRVWVEEMARRGKAREDAAELKLEMKGVAEQIKGLEAQLQEVEDALRGMLLLLPNVPDASVPVG